MQHRVDAPDRPDGEGFTVSPAAHAELGVVIINHVGREITKNQVA
jgi:hypothetical protein